MIVVRKVGHGNRALFSDVPGKTFREIYTNSPSPSLNQSMGQYFERIDNAKAKAARAANYRPVPIINPSDAMEMQSKVSQGFKARGSGGGIPAPLIGAALGIGVAATAHYFWRKRRSKNGKQIIERVRRK